MLSQSVTSRPNLALLLLQIKTNRQMNGPSTKKGSPLAQRMGGEPYM